MIEILEIRMKRVPMICKAVYGDLIISPQINKNFIFDSYHKSKYYNKCDISN